MRRALEPEPELAAKYKRAHLDPSMETVSWVSWKPCPLYLEVHPECNLSLEHKDRLRVEGLYRIDLMDKAQGFVGLGRDDLANVFDPVWLRSVGRMICHFTMQICPLGRPPALVITPWKGKVLVNNQPTPNHLAVTLTAGDEVVLIRKTNGTELKYVVVDRNNQPTMDATIGVLFAAPLVEFNPEGVKTALPELDFRNECLVLQQCLYEASRHKEPVVTGDRVFVRVPRPIHLRVHFATKQSFQNWSRGLQVLHFSGHGNDHCVYFEDDSGVAVPITPHEVAELLPSPLTLKLVFVASCASENIAQAFVAHGVPHVVGTKCNTELEDKAAIAFTRRFYDALAQGSTVQRAFDVAKNFVASLPNTRNPEVVAQKFQLLPEARTDVHGTAVLFPVDEVEKDVDTTEMSDPMEWSQVSVVPMDESSQSPESLSPPSSPTPPLYNVFPNKLHYVRPGFGFRNVDMHHLVVATHAHPVVTLTGPHGIGKTQLALATAWFLDLRQTKRDNVRFCLLGGVLDRILNETSVSCDALEHVHLEGVEASLSLTLHPDMWPNVVMFDGCDALHHHCLLRQFVEDFICRLLAQKPDLHVVLTVRTPLAWTHRLDGVGCTIEVGPLAMVDGAKLLQKELNRPLKRADYDLLELPIPATPSLSSDEMAKWVATSRVFLATGGVPAQVLALVDRLKL